MSAVMSFWKPRRRLRWHSSCLSTARGVRGKCVTPARRQSAYRGYKPQYDILQPRDGILLTYCQTPRHCKKVNLACKNRAGGWKILTNEKLEINISECIFTLLTSMIFTCWSARKSTLHPHFDYLAHRLRVFYTAFPGFFCSKKDNFTHLKSTSHYVSRCYTNHDNSSVRQRQPLPWFLRVSRRFENTIYCRFRAEEAKYQNVSYRCDGG